MTIKALRDEDYSAEFRRDYAYVVYTLGQTNRQIDAVSSSNRRGRPLMRCSRPNGALHAP